MESKIIEKDIPTKCNTLRFSSTGLCIDFSKETLYILIFFDGDIKPQYMFFSSEYIETTVHTHSLTFDVPIGNSFKKVKVKMDSATISKDYMDKINVAPLTTQH